MVYLKQSVQLDVVPFLTYEWDIVGGGPILKNNIVALAKWAVCMLFLLYVLQNIDKAGMQAR